MRTRNQKISIALVVILIALFVIIRNHSKQTGTILVPPTYVDTQNATTTTSVVVMYKNGQYGFTVDLPQSWAGYIIINSTWKGDPINGEANAIATSGSQISIRNPVWTASHPYQDIPIMIFTLDQWNRLQAEQFHIGAAPIGPSELGRNSRYVFALPARYNFAYPDGVEEVDKIIQSRPLHTF